MYTLGKMNQKCKDAIKYSCSRFFKTQTEVVIEDISDNTDNNKKTKIQAVPAQIILF